MDGSSHKSEQERSQLWDALRLVGSVGFTVVIAITVCFLGGLALSRRFDLGILPVIAATLIGVMLAFYWVYRTLSRYTERLAPVKRASDTDEETE